MRPDEFQTGICEVTTALNCKLCGSNGLSRAVSEELNGQEYTSYYCPKCDLYQTLGEVAEVSPDYVSLTAEQLDEEHIFLQHAHKRPAFDEWYARLANMDASLDRGETKRVLDIGCGVGGFLDFAAAKGLEVYGFDASAAQVAVSGARHSTVRNVVSLDAYLKELGTNIKFDYITMWDVFEHIRDPFALMADVRKHLAPDGVFFVSVPGGGLIPLRVQLLKLRNRKSAGLVPWEHVFYYTRRSLDLVFRKGGFRVVKIDGVKPYVRKLSAKEVIRRLAHRMLGKTPYAFQFSAYVKHG